MKFKEEFRRRSCSRGIVLEILLGTSKVEVFFLQKVAFSVFLRSLTLSNCLLSVSFLSDQIIFSIK